MATFLASFETHESHIDETVIGVYEIKIDAIDADEAFEKLEAMPQFDFDGAIDFWNGQVIGHAIKITQA